MPQTFSDRPRTLPAEILDQLPSDHPDALESRRDIRHFNRALGNWRWLSQVLPRYVRSGERLLEIGAGTGELCQLLVSQGLRCDGLDLAPRPLVCPPASDWHQMNLFSFTEWDRYPVCVGNLFLHHFDPLQLRTLGSQLSRHARLIAISDLCRGRVQQLGFLALACTIGANRVSRHDGWVSVRAGFRGQELPELLGLDPKRWKWRLFPHFFAYRLIAERR